MPIVDSQKTDVLWKKVTGQVTDTSISGKDVTNEIILSPIPVLYDSIWGESSDIPVPAATGSVVIQYSTASPAQCLNDNTVAGYRSWFAVSNTGAAISNSNVLKNWIPPAIDPTYLIKVYSGDPASTGTLLSSISSDYEYIFDYSAGSIHFPNSVPSSISADGLYIVGYRYDGVLGAPLTASITAAIQTLGGLTANTQTFSTATTGTDFTIVSSGGDHKFSIPDAGVSARGLITTGTQTLSGQKNFSGNITTAGSLTAGSITSSGSITAASNLTLGGSITAVNAQLSGSLTSAGNIVVLGNLTVSGSVTSFLGQTVQIVDKNIELNKGGSTTGSVGSGLSILGDSDVIVGYLKIDDSDNTKLIFKAPGASGYIKLKTGSFNTDWVLPANAGAAGYVLSTDGFGNLSWIVQSATGGGGGHTIENDGTPVTQRDNLNFSDQFVVTDNDPDTDVDLSTTIIAGSPFIVEATTSRTLLLSDAYKIIETTNAGGCTITIPTNASVAFAVGTRIEFLFSATGTVNIEGDTGVDLNGVSAGTITIDTQYGGATIFKRDTNAWVLVNGIGGVAGHTIKEDGTPLTQRNGLNFSTDFDLSDDSGNDETDVTLARELRVRLPVTTDTGTSRTLGLSDAETGVRFTNSSSVAVTIPTNASVAFETNTQIPIFQAGTGIVTITGDTGVTVNGISAGSYVMPGQYKVAFLMKTATNTWEVY